VYVWLNDDFLTEATRRRESIEHVLVFFAVALLAMVDDEELTLCNPAPRPRRCTNQDECCWLSFDLQYKVVAVGPRLPIYPPFRWNFFVCNYPDRSRLYRLTDSI
jgi:hypothetical protein